MNKKFQKIISMLLILGMNWLSLGSLEMTEAYFSDIETSTNNFFGATKLDFTIEVLEEDGFRTQTQGGWGSVANGNNVGAYRDANFAGAFPDGLIIGDIFAVAGGSENLGFYAYFEESADIEAFLPRGGTAAPFEADYYNPVNSEGGEAGVLAGQVTALSLNVGFDNYDDDFGDNQSKLENFYANEEAVLCGEMTVGEVLAEANLVLSGQESDFSSSEISDCADEINNKFVDGENEEEVKVTPAGETALRELLIEKAEGLNFQHILEIEEVGGNSDFCNALIVEASLDGDLLYSGNLLDLFNNPVVLSGGSDKWDLEIGLPADASSLLSGQSCELKYVVSGWQEELVVFGGFSDTEEVFDIIESGVWVSNSPTPPVPPTLPTPPVANVGEDFVVLNEFLPNPDGDLGSDSDDKPKGEWIELYNNDSVNDYDLTGWYLQDFSGKVIEITAARSSLDSVVIPANGWMVIYMNKAVLNNNGDEITLYNGSDVVIDSYAYTGSAPINKSYARIPDGIGAWVDPVPTPGGVNKAEEIIENEAETVEENEEEDDENESEEKKDDETGDNEDDEETVDEDEDEESDKNEDDNNDKTAEIEETDEEEIVDEETEFEENSDESEDEESDKNEETETSEDEEIVDKDKDDNSEDKETEKKSDETETSGEEDESSDETETDKKTDETEIEDELEADGNIE